jgi:hypothetical protein
MTTVEIQTVELLATRELKFQRKVFLMYLR